MPDSLPRGGAGFPGLRVPTPGNDCEHMNPPLILRPDDATDHILGPASARVAIIEYGDFECPSCGQAHGAMKVLL